MIMHHVKLDDLWLSKVMFFWEGPPTWYVETGEAAMKGVIDVWAIIRLVEMLYGEE